jgi:hypothetical protein
MLSRTELVVLPMAATRSLNGGGGYVVAIRAVAVGFWRSRPGRNAADQLHVVESKEEKAHNEARRGGAWRGVADRLVVVGQQ